MLVVVDANVVVQMLLAGGDPGPLGGHDLASPPLVRSEALSSLSELTYRGDVPSDAGRVAAGRLGELTLRLERPAGLDVRAWDIARTLGWAKTYDAEYVALAQILDAPLVTLDQRLRRGAGHLVEMPLVAELAR
jgi:predicted nucleic acid-binding protein